jgi:hypothetical protein
LLGEFTWFSGAEYAGKRKKTRREVFLEEMEQVVPWILNSRCVFHAIPDTIPLGSRTAFRRDGGHRCTLMADSVPF